MKLIRSIFQETVMTTVSRSIPGKYEFGVVHHVIRLFIPTLRNNSVLIIDSAPRHKSNKVKDYTGDTPRGIRGTASNSVEVYFKLKTRELCIVNYNKMFSSSILD
ncbi:hypothetical protein GEMRC1_009366 [Eukaryota sp. GEM-RC1]